MKKNARYRSIPCWFDPSTGDLEGKNWLYSLLVDINIWLDINVFMVEEFPLWVEVDDDDPGLTF